MRRVTLLLAAAVSWCCFAITPDEAMERLRAKAASQPATRPHDEATILRKALSNAQDQNQKLRVENAQLRTELKKAQNPAAVEAALAKTKIEAGMTKAVVDKVISANKWGFRDNKTTDYIAKVPVDLEILSLPDITDLVASSRDARDESGVGAITMAEGQPHKIIFVNDIVIYVGK